MEIKEAIKKVKEMYNIRKLHIQNYEQSNCKTTTYYNLKKEMQALEAVLTELEYSMYDPMCTLRADLENKISKDKIKIRIRKVIE